MNVEWEEYYCELYLDWREEGGVRSDNMTERNRMRSLNWAGGYHHSEDEKRGNNRVSADKGNQDFVEAGYTDIRVRLATNPEVLGR